MSADLNSASDLLVLIKSYTFGCLTPSLGWGFGGFSTDFWEESEEFDEFEDFGESGLTGSLSTICFGGGHTVGIPKTSISSSESLTSIYFSFEILEFF